MMLRWFLTGLVCVAGLVSGITTAIGQEINEAETQVRVRYQHQQLVKERTRVFGTVRYDEPHGSSVLHGGWYRWSTTGGVSYDLSSRFRLEAALGLYDTRRPQVNDLFEVRLWQAVTLDWPESLGRWRRFTFAHRLMLEERFTKTIEREFSTRLRYRLATTYPINKYSIGPGAFYVPLNVELFVTPDNEVQELFSERSRVTAGLGYVFNQTWSVELRYTRQRSHDTITGEKNTTDNILDLRFRTSIRIRDLLKSR